METREDKRLRYKELIRNLHGRTLDEVELAKLKELDELEKEKEKDENKNNWPPLGGSFCLV